MVLAVFVGCMPALVKGNCGSVGSTTADRATKVSSWPNFILSLNNSAACKGKVDSWTYCYYLNESADTTRIYKATLAFYKIEKSKMDNTFTTVNGSTIVIEHKGSEVIGEGQTCVTKEVSTKFFVEAGDLIGACFPDEFTLNIIAWANKSQENLVRMNKDCPNQIERGMSMHSHYQLLVRAGFTSSSSSGAIGVAVFIVLIFTVAIAVIATIIIIICTWYSKKNSTKSVTKETSQKGMTRQCMKRRTQNSQSKITLSKLEI